MDSAFASRPMYRIVEEAGPCLREAEDKGCALWLDASSDPDSTTEGYPWRDYTLDQTVTVHQTTGLKFVPLLPGRRNGR
jgi:hypothetical protein